jgi:DNA-directed RNA polymerase subunit RPC12/RpoP
MKEHSIIKLGGGHFTCSKCGKTIFGSKDHKCNMITERELKDIDCMSGTGWIPRESEIECPYCSHYNTISNKNTKTCSSCKKIFNIEYGVQHLMRAVDCE